MILQSERELVNTREKLRMLEELYQKHLDERSEDKELREMSTESLMRLINQLKEEILRYEARHAVRR